MGVVFFPHLPRHKHTHNSNTCARLHVHTHTHVHMYLLSPETAQTGTCLHLERNHSTRQQVVDWTGRRHRGQEQGLRSGSLGA